MKTVLQTLTETAMTAKLPEAALNEMSSSIVLKRLGTPEDIADEIVRMV